MKLINPPTDLMGLPLAWLGLKSKLLTFPHENARWVSNIFARLDNHIFH